MNAVFAGLFIFLYFTIFLINKLRVKKVRVSHYKFHR